MELCSAAFSGIFFGIFYRYNNNNNIFYLNTVGFKANIAYGAV